MKQKNIETSSFSLGEEIEKVKRLPKEQRLDYLWTYYKTPLLLALAFLILGWMVVSFAVNAFMGTFFPKAPISIAVVAQSWDDAALNAFVEDCKEAIGYAIENAQPDDLILLAGKGHEDYQILGTTKIHFDEKEIVKEFIDRC